MVVARVLQRLLELRGWDPLGQEVGGHVRIRDVIELDLALGFAPLEHRVAPQEVLGVRRAAGAGSDAEVGEVDGADEGRGGRRHAERAEDLAGVGDGLARLGGRDPEPHATHSP